MKRYREMISLFLFVVHGIDAIPNGDAKHKKRHVVYSHGFGEYGKMRNDFDFLGDTNSAPIYPDAPGNLSKGVFYTKPAVHVLANHLSDKANEGENSIVLVGFSNGAGIEINCLAALIDYDPEYFQGTNIRCKADADKIIAAINNGARIQTAPLLGLRKSKLVADSSIRLSGGTFAAATVGALWCTSDGKAAIDLVKVGILGAGALAYYIYGDFMKDIYSSGIKHIAVPWITNYNFDRNHPESIDQVEKLHGKMTCPTLLHFHKHDKILENPDDDTIKVYEALKGDKTHIIITDDASHNRRSLQFIKELHSFKKRYFDHKAVDESTTQPTVEELKKQIYCDNVTSILPCNKQ